MDDGDIREVLVGELEKAGIPDAFTIALDYGTGTLCLSHYDLTTEQKKKIREIIAGIESDYYDD